MSLSEEVRRLAEMSPRRRDAVTYTSTDETVRLAGELVAIVVECAPEFAGLGAAPHCANCECY